MTHHPLNQIEHKDVYSELMTDIQSKALLGHLSESGSQVGRGFGSVNWSGLSCVVVLIEGLD